MCDAIIITLDISITMYDTCDAELLITLFHSLYAYEIDQQTNFYVYTIVNPDNINIILNLFFSDGKENSK